MLLLSLSGCGAAAYNDYLDALDEATFTDTSTDSESSSGTGNSFGGSFAIKWGQTPPGQASNGTTGEKILASRSEAYNLS